MVPLTVPLMERSLAPLGIDVRGARILVPVHRFDSTIETLDGRIVAAGDGVRSEPAFTASGDRAAYTLESGGVSEIWTISLEESSAGASPQYVTTGRHPRFAPNGLELVFARTGPDGNRDIWKTDIRTGVPNRLTDDPALDDMPDWSPDGRTIIFYSEAGGRRGIWTIPSTGGQRVRWSDQGYWPRYSEDGNRVAYWTPDGVVIADARGRVTGNAQTDAPFGPPVWISGVAVVVVDMRLPEPLLPSGGGPGGLPIGAVLDRAADGTWALEVIDIESTAIWRLDLQYTEE
jgi:dipeptidyl aminopeptidase/acylaminoacyl peptidase